MQKNRIIEGWQFTRGIDLHSARRVADERPGEFDTQARVLSAGQGWIRAQVVSGEPKVGAVLYVAGEGLFEVTRRDEWGAGSQAPRVLLMLKTLPHDPRAAAREQVSS